MPDVSYKELGPTVEIPDSFYGSLIIRCMKKSFGPSKSSGEPLVTVSWEIVGVKNKADGSIDRSIKEGDQEYVIAGLNASPDYHSLSKKAMRYFAEWWSKCTDKPVEEFRINTENPDLGFLDDLVMSAVCRANVVEKRKPLSDEQRKTLQDQGLKVEGELVTDEEGNPVPPLKFIKVESFNRRYKGELPAF